MPLSLPTSLPALTALATVIAAGIGGVVALVVALVNAWSARRVAIDAAHREFRSELAKAAVTATRELMTQLHSLDRIVREKDHAAWHRIIDGMRIDQTHGLGLRLKTDLRTPHDEVFAAALKLFKLRRAHLEVWLSINRNEIPAFGITVATAYIREASEIVQIAAEGYIFNLRKPRKRAQRLLKKIDPLVLKKRIDARLAMYQDAFGDDDDEEIELVSVE